MIFFKKKNHLFFSFLKNRANLLGKKKSCWMYQAPVYPPKNEVYKKRMEDLRSYYDKLCNHLLKFEEFTQNEQHDQVLNCVKASSLKQRTQMLNKGKGPGSDLPIPKKISSVEEKHLFRIIRDFYFFKKTWEHENQLQLRQCPKIIPYPTNPYYVNIYHESLAINHSIYDQIIENIGASRIDILRILKKRLAFYEKATATVTNENKPVLQKFSFSLESFPLLGSSKTSLVNSNHTSESSVTSNNLEHDKKLTKESASKIIKPPPPPPEKQVVNRKYEPTRIRRQEKLPLYYHWSKKQHDEYTETSSSSSCLKEPKNQQKMVKEIFGLPNSTPSSSLLLNAQNADQSDKISSKKEAVDDFITLKSWENWLVASNWQCNFGYESNFESLFQMTPLTNLALLSGASKNKKKPTEKYSEKWNYLFTLNDYNKEYKFWLPSFIVSFVWFNDMERIIWDSQCSQRIMIEWKDHSTSTVNFDTIFEFNNAKSVSVPDSFKIDSIWSTLENNVSKWIHSRQVK